MNSTELDQAIRQIGRLERPDEWELADKLAAFTAMEYERTLPRLMSETGWTRHRLTALRMTAKQWPADERLKDVPLALHQQYRYKPDDLRTQHRNGTLGQATPAKRRQQWTLTNMSAAIRSALDVLDDPVGSPSDKLSKLADLLMVWRGEEETDAQVRESGT